MLGLLSNTIPLHSIWLQYHLTPEKGTTVSISGQEKDSKRVLYVFVCMLIVKLKQ